MLDTDFHSRPMLFNSIDFLLFFPAVVLLYFAWPQRRRHLWLLAASYFFYACWNLKYAVLLLFSTVATWLTALAVERLRGDGRQRARILLASTYAICIASNLGLLALFKYLDFAIASANAVLGPAGFHFAKPPALDFLLPVGISFYTFQALGYVIDVRRGAIAAERNFLRYALFVSFFPQLLAGPIGRTPNLLPQFRAPTFFNVENVRRGLLSMAYGLFLKVVAADNFAAVVDPVFDNFASASGMRVLVATVLFAFQIYCDFEGYTQMAIGAARVLGFRLRQNFRQPYLATSPRDFWRRWHMSLTTWFRDYLYFTLGGSRRGVWRKRLNVMVVFLVSGLWHGAAWNFVAWGGLNGLLLVAQDATEGLRRRILRAFGVSPASAAWRVAAAVLTFILIDAAWLLFRVPGMSAAWPMARRVIADFNPLYFISGDFIAALGPPRQAVAVVVSLAIVAAADLLRSARPGVAGRILAQPAVVRWTLYLLALALIITLGAYGKGNASPQFIYFQF
ncbi:MAG: MBOAT family protein [Kiritimatiellae bacterium]|nr:MBOAT family protein [Kiritimatiellia bacterium]